MDKAMQSQTRDGIRESTVLITSGQTKLVGDLAIPPKAKSIILFAHGSGSSRLSSRNRFVAGHLQREGLATLLFDLLTSDEEKIDSYNMKLRFDIDLLAHRLSGATEWLKSQREVAPMPVGYFGASTGAAAALIAGTMHPDTVRAIVSRGGRPDLASRALPLIQVPTLLIVGGDDREVIMLNQMAMEKIKATKKIVIVPGATHLFEEPGALEAVSEQAAFWFKQYLDDK